MFHVEQFRGFDVLVVGGGHAGVEAAAAAARRGAKTALITHQADTIGVMSCNPSIGGVGKGHLVREVDALDGLMARAADASAIHHRMLNRSKGLAVRGPRIQADRRLYRSAIQRMLHLTGVQVIEGDVADLAFSTERLRGVILADGTSVDGVAVVLATGTFLGGRIFRGDEREEGGRIGERAATLLADRLREAASSLRRLKTGTPPRLDGRTIDWSRLDRQPSDEESWHMSFIGSKTHLPQVACAITRTTAQTHDHIRAGIAASPLFSGDIEGRGPRYCPSIEDKVMRFGDRDGHQIFLEPEGLDDTTVYPNGLSTSLSRETQEALIQSIDGLQDTRITMYGYAVEYDYLDPRGLDHRLGMYEQPGVFCAGQINGTTGYEEAAAQGLVAGVNAAAHALDLEPLFIDRADGYTGVMIDDLVLQGVSEPYRMLTARAEYRLSLRCDNAETRLAEIAERTGILTDERKRTRDDRNRLRADARQGRTHDCPPDIFEEVAEDARYAPYIARQKAEIEQMRREGHVMIDPCPEALRRIPGLSHEMVERLVAAKPANLDQASRVRGVTPAALSALWLHAKRCV